jgi:hypothetical protein
MTRDLIEMFKKYEYHDASCFGHALEGNLHLVFSQGFRTEVRTAPPDPNQSPGASPRELLLGALLAQSHWGLVRRFVRFPARVQDLGRVS